MTRKARELQKPVYEKARADRKPNVCAVVLFWNNFDDTKKCLTSLLCQDFPALRVVVVDNGSNDESSTRLLTWLREDPRRRVTAVRFDEVAGFSHDESGDEHLGESEMNTAEPASKEVVLISSTDNRGFGGGMNVGIQFCVEAFDPHYAILVNNDTTAERSLISELVEKMESEESIAVAAPTVEWAIKISALHPCSSMRSHNIPVDREISGCFMIVRTEALKKVGGFDESFFIFFEETDLFIRFRQSGYRVVDFPTEAKVHHISSRSTSTLGEVSVFHVGRSAVVYWRKHRSILFMRFVLSTVLNSGIGKCDFRLAAALIRGIVSGFRAQITNRELVLCECEGKMKYEEG